MSNVTILHPARDKDLILKCSCGCLSFTVHVNAGVFCCTFCEEEYIDDLSGCEVRKEHVIEVAPDATGKTVHKAETAAIIVMKMSGKTIAWSQGFEGSEEIEAWYQRRVAGLMELLG